MFGTILASFGFPAHFDKKKWFYVIKDVNDQVFSAAARDFVALDHPTFVEFLAAGNVPHGTITREELESQYLVDFEMSGLEFMDRLTLEEQVGILLSEDPEVKVFLAKLQLAGYIDLRDPRIAAGLALMASKGLLTESRAAIIGTPSY